MRPAFHLVPASVWSTHVPNTPYVAGSLASEGFIHCTDGEDELLDTANRHYRGDPRPFVALVVDLDRCRSPWRVEDERSIYPHIFGPIAPDAIVEQRVLQRTDDGRFVALSPAAGTARTRGQWSR